MRRSALFGAGALLIGLLPAVAAAQPADLPIPAATTSQYPPGVKVAKTAAGPVYVDAQGHTLYGMDMRTLLRWSPDPAQYCKGACAEQWQPLLAPPESRPNIMFPRGFGDRPPQRAAGGSEPAPATREGTSPAAAAATVAGPAPGTNDPRFRKEVTADGRTIVHPAEAPQRPADTAYGEGPRNPEEGFVQPQKAPDWTVIAGPQGPQWVYKGWHMVYVRKGDKPGSTAFDGADNFTWNTLKFIPPVPTPSSPGNVTVAFADGAYALTDSQGRVLFTGSCKGDCAGWKPLAAGLADRGLGEWSVGRAGDTPQWLYRGKPVFVSQEDDPTHAPKGGAVLRP